MCACVCACVCMYVCVCVCVCERECGGCTIPQQAEPVLHMKEWPFGYCLGKEVWLSIEQAQDVYTVSCFFTSPTFVQTGCTSTAVCGSGCDNLKCVANWWFEPMLVWCHTVCIHDLYNVNVHCTIMHLLVSFHQLPHCHWFPYIHTLVTWLSVPSDQLTQFAFTVLAVVMARQIQYACRQRTWKRIIVLCLDSDYCSKLITAYLSWKVLQEGSMVCSRLCTGTGCLLSMLWIQTLCVCVCVCVCVWIASRAGMRVCADVLFTGRVHCT